MSPVPSRRKGIYLIATLLFASCLFLPAAAGAEVVYSGCSCQYFVYGRNDYNWDVNPEERCGGKTLGFSDGADYSVTKRTIGRGFVGMCGNRINPYYYEEASFVRDRTACVGASHGTDGFYENGGDWFEFDVDSDSNEFDDSVLFGRIFCQAILTELCGNGALEAGEECDEGTENGDCPKACSISCTFNSNCPEELSTVPTPSPEGTGDVAPPPAVDTGAGSQTPAAEAEGDAAAPQATTPAAVSGGSNRGSGIINPCALTDPATGYGEGGYCGDVNQLLLQVIMIGEFVFKIIGAVAFFFFIYGGLTYILSMGNAERTKKAQGIIAAAVIGLVIVFSAYILIGFVLEALNVAPEFRGVG